MDELAAFLPLRVRVRLRVTRLIDSAAVWLAEHGCTGAAAKLWRVTGLT
jgi:hypothetical protein